MRDITLGDTFTFCFTTRRFTTGIPYTCASLALSVKEGANDTVITAGVSVDPDTGSTPITGLNEGTVVASGANGYEAGKSYAVYISAGTIDSVSVVGEVVEQFTIQASAAAVDLANATDGLGALKTACATATGFATPTNITSATGIDVTKLLGTAWLTPAVAGTPDVNAKQLGGAPVTATTSVTFPAASTVATTTGAVGSVTGAVGSVTGLTASDVGAIKTKTDFLPSATAGNAGGVFIAGSNAATTTAGLTTGALATGTITTTGNLSVSGTTTLTGAVSMPAGLAANITGNLTGTIGGMTAVALKDFFDTDSGTTYAAAVAGSVVKEIVDNAGGSALTEAGIATAVWQDTTGTDFNVAGSIGKSLFTSGNAPGAASGIALVGSNMGAVTSVSGNVGGLVVGTVAGVTPAAVADIPTAVQNADALLNRDMSAVSDTNARSPLNALRFLRNKWDISSTTLTVKKEDDTATAWTATVTATPGADPITGNDPA